MRGLLRIIFLIPLAFVLSCLGAGLFFVLGLIGIGPDGAYLGPYFWDTMLLGLAVASATGAWVALPAFAGIVLAEAFRWRSVLVYLLFGAGLGLWVMVALQSSQALPEDVSPALWPASGCVGGFLYWLLAGRSAGLAEPPGNP